MNCNPFTGKPSLVFTFTILPFAVRLQSLAGEHRLLHPIIGSTALSQCSDRWDVTNHIQPDTTLMFQSIKSTHCLVGRGDSGYLLFHRVRLVMLSYCLQHFHNTNRSSLSLSFSVSLSVSRATLYYNPQTNDLSFCSRMASFRSDGNAKSFPTIETSRTKTLTEARVCHRVPCMGG